MTVRFTSDLHLGHARILDFEPGRRHTLGATDTDTMNRRLIDRWNDTVGADDTTFIVGDACMGTIRDTLPLIDELNGAKVLVVGNHDRPFIGKMLDDYMEHFAAVVHGATLHFDDSTGLTCLVSHFPYRDSATAYDTRFIDYHPLRGLRGEDLLLHGHVHSAWRALPGQINVGCDVWGWRPRTVREMLTEVLS